LLLLQALGLPVPQYGHISLILGNDGTPLSKRNGSQSIQELKAQGWLAEGVINYLARLGHTYPRDHYLSFEQLAEDFSLERLVRSPAHFDQQQLRHWQQMAVAQVSQERLWNWMGSEVHALVPVHHQTAFMSAVRPNILYPHEALRWATILFKEPLTMQPDAQTTLAQAGRAFFQQALTALADSQGDYKKLIHQLKVLTNTQGKTLFMPLRAALTGETHGPEMVNLLPLMGIERARQRLEACL
jgi:glutamyl-tRNA synthetase